MHETVAEPVEATRRRRPRRRARDAALVVVAAVAVIAGCTGSPSGSVTDATRTMSLLFVQNAQSGSLEPVAGSGDHDLRLRGVEPSTSWFSDRPQRQAGTEPTSAVVGDWDAYGFRADPPNAALVLTDHPEREDTVIVELRDPRYDEAARELHYRVRVLDTPREGLGFAVGQAPAQLPATFAAASLFIDDATVRATTTAGNDLQATATTTGTSIAATTTSAAAATTSAPVASPTGATSAACTSYLSSFTSAATAGTYTSNAQTITFPDAVKLQNPPAPGSTTATQTVTIPFVVNGSTGSPVSPSAAAPVTISIYGAPAGSLQTSPAGTGTSPVVVEVASGSSITVTYDGAYLERPLSVLASMPLAATNVCTGTTSYAIGSTTMTLAVAPTALGTVSYSTPTLCTGGTTGAACATQNVDSTGLALTATAGYGATVPGAASKTASTPQKFASYTVDTGSIGTVLPLTDLGPDAVGPGAPALKYYDSSGNEFIGFVYLAPVTLQMGSVQATTDPIRLLAVMSSACHPDKTCTQAPPYASFHYLGVGFDRSLASAADPFQSPRDNALLAIDPPSGSMTQGYTLSGATIQAGITAANSTAPSPAQLTASTTYPGDWQSLPMCVTFPTTTDPAPTPTCGSMLMDVGIPEMFITFSSASAKPAAVADGLAANQQIQVQAPNPTNPALTLSFSSGPAGGASPPAVGMAPSAVDLGVLASSGSPVFINTGRHVLFENTYIFNAQAGTIGFAPLVPTLR
jgi:hypothetical protein